MKKSQKILILSAIASMALAGAARAQIIGIDFSNGGATDQSPASTDVVGPYASAGWYNDVNIQSPGTVTSLLDSNDTATGATFAFNNNGDGNSMLNGGNPYSVTNGAVGGDQVLSGNGSPATSFSPDQLLYNGGIATASLGATSGQEVILQNIPFSTYSIYVLVTQPNDSGNGTSAGSLQIFNGGTVGGAGAIYTFQNTCNAWNDGGLGASSGDGNIWNIPGPTPGVFPGYVQAVGTTQATATQNGNYVLFDGLSGANQTIDMEGFPGPWYNPDAMTAIEIVNTAAVPEPATWATALCGLGMLLSFEKIRARGA